MLVQGAFNLLFRPGLRKEFRDNYTQHEREYDQFLRYSTTTMPEQSATIMTGLSRMIERGDGEPITYELPVLGPKVMGVDKEFAGGFMITRKTVEDDQYNKADQGARWLAHAANMTREYRAAAFLDDAFTGTTFKGIDGLSWLNTAHTFLNASGTWANATSSPVQVSVTGITALLDLFQVLKDHNGDPIKMSPTKLIIGNNTGDLHRAMQIFQTDKEPFTAENQDNAIKKRFGNMKIMISRYKSSLKSYFMVDEKWNDAHFVVRRETDFDDTFDFDTDVAKYKSTQRFLIWGVDPRGWAGSNPT